MLTHISSLMISGKEVAIVAVAGCPTKEEESPLCLQLDLRSNHFRLECNDFTAAVCGAV